MPPLRSPAPGRCAADTTRTPSFVAATASLSQATQTSREKQSVPADVSSSASSPRRPYQPTAEPLTSTSGRVSSRAISASTRARHREPRTDDPPPLGRRPQAVGDRLAGEVDDGVEPARRRRSASSDVTIRSGVGRSAAWARSRVSTVTSWPAATSASTRRRPTKPVPPVTSTAWRRVSARGERRGRRRRRSRGERRAAARSRRPESDHADAPAIAQNHAPWPVDRQAPAPSAAWPSRSAPARAGRAERHSSRVSIAVQHALGCRQPARAVLLDEIPQRDHHLAPRSAPSAPSPRRRAARSSRGRRRSRRRRGSARRAGAARRACEGRQARRWVSSW